MENNQKHIEEIVKEAFASHEVEVGAHVWANVQAGMAANTAGVAATGATSLMKAASIVGLSTVTLLGGINEVVLHSDQNVVAHNEVMEESHPTAPQTENVVVVSEDAWAAEEETQNIERKNSNEAEEASAESNSANTATSEVVNEEVAHVGNHMQDEASEHVPRPGASGADNHQEDVAEDTKQDPKPEKEEENALVKKEDKDTQDHSGSDIQDEEAPKQCAIRFTHDAKTFISPNGDGAQDCFSVQGVENVESFHIRIWTQAGELLAESSDVNFSWCGTNRFGKVLENRSSCYYQVDAFDADGLQYKAPNAKGHIMVFR
ncbi:MAG TPA: hypothetical protein DCX14_12245 [Flavobacteriales bacterium]|jgi:gliding motility-associated-like protein|nr:gliding motility-associated C-terminal domain-containing protein [Flavobacteriales bacterium]HAW20944.1 hypothetical protein [Flavobacteriales bacterium]